MFNIGGGELIVILLIALIVLGPQRLPDAARQLGKAMGDLRRLSTGFQNEMKQALDTADDPTRVAARRNVLATEVVAPAEATDAAPVSELEPAPVGEPELVAPEADPADADAAAAESIAAVSAQPSAPATQGPSASQARAAAKKVAPPVDAEDPTRPTSA